MLEISPRKYPPPFLEKGGTGQPYRTSLVDVVVEGSGNFAIVKVPLPAMDSGIDSLVKIFLYCLYRRTLFAIQSGKCSVVDIE